MKIVTGIAVALLATSAFAVNVEKQAQFKARVNAERAKCLKQAVDNKARYDIQVGKINDFGNVRTASVCEEYVYDNLIKQMKQERDAAKKLVKDLDVLIP